MLFIKKCVLPAICAPRFHNGFSVCHFAVVAAKRVLALTVYCLCFFFTRCRFDS